MSSFQVFATISGLSHVVWTANRTCTHESVADVTDGREWASKNANEDVYETMHQAVAQGDHVNTLFTIKTLVHHQVGVNLLLMDVDWAEQTMDMLHMYEAVENTIDIVWTLWSYVKHHVKLYNNILIKCNLFLY